MNSDGDLTELQATAVASHELFLAYKAAGFSTRQAFQLVRDVLVTSLGKDQA